MIAGTDFFRIFQFTAIKGNLKNAFNDVILYCDHSIIGEGAILAAKILLIKQCGLITNIV